MAECDGQISPVHSRYTVYIIIFLIIKRLMISIYLRYWYLQYRLQYGTIGIGLVSHFGLTEKTLFSMSCLVRTYCRQIATLQYARIPVLGERSEIQEEVLPATNWFCLPQKTNRTTALPQYLVLCTLYVQYPV